MAQILRSIGWDVHTSLQEGRNRGIEDHVWSRISDAEQLAVARSIDRILIAFDEFRGRHGAEVAAELQLNGGRIIQISRGPEQRVYRSVAKLLWHFDEYIAFLKAQSGVAILHDVRQTPRLLTVDEYGRRTVTPSSRTYFDEYLATWKDRELEPIPRRPVLTGEERSSMNPLPETPSDG